MKVVPPDSAVVIGRFGIYKTTRTDAVFWKLEAERLPDGKTWNLPLVASNTAADGNSVPFFVELPPGRYVLTRWEVTTTDHEISGENVGVLFDLPAGKVSCIGGVYVGTRGVPDDRSGSALQFPAGTVLKDDCEQLSAQLKHHAPMLAAPEKKLAVGATETVGP
jgi:hypothetical protein